MAAEDNIDVEGDFSPDSKYENGAQLTENSMNNVGKNSWVKQV